MSRTQLLQVSALLLVLLLYRGVWMVGAVYLELDGSVYERAASDYARHLSDWRQVEVNEQNYTAIEYWPLLYPLLSGVGAGVWGGSADAAARTVSFLAAFLTLPFVYLLARQMWGHQAALWAVALTGFSSTLTWYATVPRSEPLHGLFLIAGMACAVSRRTALCALAGALFALSYMTRFEGLTAVLLGPCTIWLLHSPTDGSRPWRPIGALVGAFCLVSFPYWHFLTALNGHFSVATQQKQVYDALEALWVTRGGDIVNFAAQFGPPGLVHLDPAEVAGMGSESAWWWASNACLGLPYTLAAAMKNWSYIVAALAFLEGVRHRLDRRVWVVLIWMSPAVLVSLASFWDPAPRYYGFTVVLLALLAAPLLEDLRCGREQLEPLLLAAFPLLITADLYLPGGTHFDTSAPLSRCFTAADGALACCWMTGIASGAAALSLTMRLTRRQKGVYTAVAVGGMVGALVVGIPRGVLPLCLVTVLYGLQAIYLLLAARRPLLGICLVALALSLVNLITMRLVDRAFVDQWSSLQVAHWLREHPEPRRIMALAGYDVLRSGHDYRPFVMPLRGEPIRGADALLLYTPLPAQSPLRGLADRTGHRVLMRIPSYNLWCDLEGAWVLYDLRPDSPP